MDLVQETMSQFVDELMKHKDFSNLEQYVLDQMKLDIMTRLENRINAAILSNIPADKLEEFDKLLNSGSDEELQNFIKINVKNLEQMLAVELVNFQKLYLS